jgi:hypothetical protein
MRIRRVGRPSRLCVLITLSLLTGLATPVAASRGGPDSQGRSLKVEGGAVDEIKRVIEDAYVKGLHEHQDEAAVRGGFHDEFRMYVRQDDGIVPVAVGEWLARVDELRADDPEPWQQATRVHFDTVDVSGDCAVAKLTVHKGPHYFSTDYMLLYRLDEGWRIVAKVFTTRPIVE